MTILIKNTYMFCVKVMLLVYDNCLYTTIRYFKIGASFKINKYTVFFSDSGG